MKAFLLHHALFFCHKINLEVSEIYLDIFIRLEYYNLKIRL